MHMECCQIGNELGIGWEELYVNGTVSCFLMDQEEIFEKKGGWEEFKDCCHKTQKEIFVDDDEQYISQLRIRVLIGHMA